MGAVPLLTREGEVNLARRMERGQAADAEGHQPVARWCSCGPSRSASRSARKSRIWTRSSIWAGSGRRQRGVRQAAQRSEEQAGRNRHCCTRSWCSSRTSWTPSALSNKKLRKKLAGASARGRGCEVSQAIRKVPFYLSQWKAVRAKKSSGWWTNCRTWNWICARWRAAIEPDRAGQGPGAEAGNPQAREDRRGQRCPICGTRCR